MENDVPNKGAVDPYVKLAAPTLLGLNISYYI